MHQRKLRLELRLELRPKLKLPVGEELAVPAEDLVVDDHRLSEVGKFHHLNYLFEQNNQGKMAEVDHGPEVFLLNHYSLLLVL